jgi:hypothetical protein
MRRIWLLPALAALVVGLAACGGSDDVTAEEAPATTAEADTATAAETGAPAETATAETGLAANAESIRALLDSTVTQLSEAQSIDDVATALADAGAQAQAEADSLPQAAEPGFEDDVAQLRQGLMSLGADLERIAGELQSSDSTDALAILSEIQGLPAIEQINQALSSIAVTVS